MYINQIFVEAKNNISSVYSNTIKQPIESNITCDEYISQFLSIFDKQDSMSIECSQMNIYNQSSQQNTILNKLQMINSQQSVDMMLSIRNSETRSYKSEKYQHKKSIFHNFQKHLVTTLRNVIQIKKNNIASSNCAYKMWKIFICSKNYNKCFLHILFGQFQDEFDEEIYYRYGYNQIIQFYTVLDIQQAQKYLRFETLRQLSLANINKYMQKRRILKKTEFLEYFHSFIKSMEEGPIGKRFSKEKIYALTQSLKSSIQIQGYSLSQSQSL